MDTLDASSWRCPRPLLQAKLWLKGATAGQKLRLCISDTGSRQDIPRYLLRMGHSVIQESDDGRVLTLLITKVP
ncbi:MAG: sulfurtransferase TusA family protein [Candidatus Oceanisphaera merdipullorum]|nr:sulfurtransferase TusA family protein [Candidatus Oceanisphaera merdipullorum]